MEMMDRSEMQALFAELLVRLDRLEGKAQRPVPERPTHLSRKQAAAYLNVSLKTLDTWAEDGQIRRAKFGSGQRARVLYRRVDLDGFVEAHLELDADGARQIVRTHRRSDAHRHCLK